MYDIIRDWILNKIYPPKVMIIPPPYLRFKVRYLGKWYSQNSVKSNNVTSFSFTDDKTGELVDCDLAIKLGNIRKLK